MKLDSVRVSACPNYSRACGLKFGPWPLGCSGLTGNAANTRTAATCLRSAPTKIQSPGFVVTMRRPGSAGRAPVIVLPSLSSRVTTPVPSVRR